MQCKNARAQVVWLVGVDSKPFDNLSNESEARVFKITRNRKTASMVNRLMKYDLVSLFIFGQTKGKIRLQPCLSIYHYLIWQPIITIRSIPGTSDRRPTVQLQLRLMYILSLSTMLLAPRVQMIRRQRILGKELFRERCRETRSFF